jgi:hypothetical protein
VALDPTKIKVQRPISLLEEEQAEKLYEEERDKVTFGQAVDAAFAEENTMSYIFNGLEKFKPDESFRLNPDIIKKYTEGIPEDRIDFVADAVSEKHLEKLSERAKNSVKNQEVLTKYGWGGTALQIGAATLDVPAITATIATEGVLAPLIWGSKATRLARAFRGAAGSSASAAAIESYLVSQNSIKDPYDILYAAGAGFVLGGAFGSVFGKASSERYKKAFIDLQENASKNQVNDINLAMKDQGIDTSVGAMQNPDSRSAQDFDIRRGVREKIDEAESEPYADYSKVRIDMGGQTRASPLGLTRKTSAEIFEDAVNPGPITADLDKTIRTKVSSNEFYIVYDKQYEGWAKENNLNPGERLLEKRKNEFGRLVSDEIESPGTSNSQYVITAARNTAKIQTKILKDAKKYRVKGFEDIPEDLTYFTHLWDGHRFIKANNLGFGEKQFINLFKGSFRSANPSVDENVAESIAKGMVKKIIKREVGVDSGLARIFSTSNRETLRDILLEEELLSVKDANRLIKQLDFDREGVSPRAKRRLKFDMTASIEFNGKTLHIKDLMERDTEVVVNAYINQMQGKIALAKKGFYSDADFEARKKDIRAEGLEKGELEQAERDIEKLEVGYALISGKPSPLIGNPGSKYNRIARLLMDYNFLRVMNQVGFAQISELGNAVSIDGVTALIRVIPDFKKMLKRAENGQLEDKLSRELEALVAPGVDRTIMQSMNKYSVEDLYSMGKGDGIDKAINFVQPIKRAVADISGLAPITTLFERAAARIALQSLVDVASGIPKLRMKKLGNTTLEQDIKARLANLGLNESMWGRVVNQIQDNVSLEDSMFLKKRKVKAINAEDWEDKEALEALSFAIARWTRQSIQQNDIGNLNIHMTSTMGKIFTQFRAFMLVSHSKQFLHNIKRRDFAAFEAMMWSTFFGANSYILQTHVNSLGRDDKNKFLKERLSVEEIGKAAFVRSTWAALLPTGIDTLSWATGQEPIFSYKRSTGLATGIVAGNPVFDLLDTTGKVLQGGSRALLNPDYVWSRSQQRALNSILPLQNAIGIKNILNMMVEGLPERARVD